jgi:signal transduction histidine kinase
MLKPVIPDVSTSSRATLKNTWGSSAATLKNRLSQATESSILFSAIAVFVLALIWGTTLNLIKVERAAAERSAAVSSREMADTYEAQVVRALREIDQTLKFVKYAYESTGKYSILHDLKTKTLLPPDLLFAVSIADEKGDVVASSRPSEIRNVADQEYFKTQRRANGLWVSRPWKSPGSAEWKLQFGRRLDAPDGKFAGVVMVAVDSAYFVSIYEPAKLGEHGVLGILGTDGVFRARRSGETVSAGDMGDYAAVVPTVAAAESEATLTTNAWDGVRRYTSARQLYDFPMVIVVGLSEDEQLAATRQDMHAYLWRATAGSVLLILIVAIMKRMSRQLALSRLRAIDALEEKVQERTKQLLQAQEELVRKEKMAVLGLVAGSVGHELRNPLGVMSNAVYFLQTVLVDADDTTREYLNIIKNEIAGSERIVSDLLDSVRTKPPQPEAVGLAELIGRTLGKLTIQTPITVKLDIPATLPLLLVDAQQIHQVFRNLISNGVEAMPEGGTLEIGAVENKSDGTVTVSVRDSGIGMTQEQLGKLFQPLFTTKARGIGLGLVVVKNLTQTNGGNIEVQSEAGKGTTFTVTLPAANQPPDTQRV